MTSSARDLTPVPAAGALAGEALAELLSVIAEAPDHASAAAFVLEQLAEASGSERGAIIALTPGRDAVQAIAVRALDPEEREALRMDIDRDRHPLVAAVLAIIPTALDRSVTDREGLPFPKGVLVFPFAQPQARSTPALLPERRIADLGPGVTAIPTGGSSQQRRFGHSPFGAVLLDGDIARDAASSLARAVQFAGPVLARMAWLDELRESAARLDHQRDLLTAIVNSLPDPIVITDATNDIVVQNRRAEHLLSGRDSHSEGRRRAVEINNLLFTSYLARAVMASGGESGPRELNLVDPDEGADLLFEVLAHPLPGDIAPDGAYISVLRDVTDLRRAGHELERQFQRVRLAEIEARRERDRLNLILENVADPILVTDDRSNIILMNRHAERLFQPPEGQIAPPGMLASIRGNDTRFTSFVSDFTIGSAPIRRERMPLTDPGSGVELPIEVVSGKILNDRGEPTVIVSVLHDLTKQVENERLFEELKKFSAELEGRVRAATADIAERNVQLQRQSAELEKANRLKSEFLASMSHELRTPINAVIGYTALMADKIYGELTPRQDEGLRRIRASSEHLLALINDILDLAKIEAGKMPMHYEMVAIGTLLTELATQVEPMMRNRAVRFEVDVPTSTAPIRTDRTRLKQILLNLLSNALKFTREGTVTLRVRQDPVSTAFAVADTGIGIAPENLHAIWEDFRQLDQSRTREHGGTGLGLSITRKLVAGLGGHVDVESEYGRGSTFTVTLPRERQREPTPVS